MRLRKSTASAWVFVATTSAVVAVCIIIGVLGAECDSAELRLRPVPFHDATCATPESAPRLHEKVVKSLYLTEGMYQRGDGQAASEAFEDGPREGAGWIVAASQFVLDETPYGPLDWSAATRSAGPTCDPDLRVHKVSDSSWVDPDGRITYTIWLSNTGDAPATNVVVTDVLDANLRLCSSLPEPDSGDGSVWVWKSPQLSVGDPVSIVITATAVSALPHGLPLTNVVYARSQEVSAISSTCVVTVSAPVLSLNKTDSPDPVAPGGLLTYKIVYGNSGNVGAAGVCVREVYDDLTCFEEADPTPEPGYTDKWCHPGVLEPDGENQFIAVTVTVSSSAPTGTVLSNTVYLSSSETSTICRTIITGVSAPDFSLDNTDWPDPVAPGGLLTYTIVYSNSGNAGVTGVCVHEDYDALTDFKWADPMPETGYSDKWCHRGILQPDGENQFITATVGVGGSAPLGTVLSNTVFLSLSGETLVSKTITTSVNYHYIWLPLAAQSCPPGWWCHQNDQNLKGKIVFALAGCSDGTLFAGAEDGVYRRAPGEFQWRQEVSTTGEVRGLAASSDCAVVYAADLGQGVLSRDGGSWSLVSTPRMTGARTVLLCDGKVLAGGDFGVEYSWIGTNHDWDSCEARLDDDIVMSLVGSDGWVYVAVWGGGVLRFSDCDCDWYPNHTWQEMGLNKRFALQAIGSSIDGEPEFVGLHDGWYRWDGGEWVRCGDVRTFCFAVDGDTVYVGQGGSGVWRGVDDGVIWTPMNNGWEPPDEVHALLIHVDVAGQRWLYAGTTDGVWRYSLDYWRRSSVSRAFGTLEADSILCIPDASD